MRSSENRLDKIKQEFWVKSFFFFFFFRSHLALKVIVIYFLTHVYRGVGQPVTVCVRYHCCQIHLHDSIPHHIIINICSWYFGYEAYWKRRQIISIVLKKTMPSTLNAPDIPHHKDKKGSSGVCTINYIVKFIAVVLECNSFFSCFSCSQYFNPNITAVNPVIQNIP